jgi:hypothetical protein
MNTQLQSYYKVTETKNYFIVTVSATGLKLTEFKCTVEKFDQSY